MADPITIIGLAASVAQIVDVTARLISKSCEIYANSEGAFQENADLEIIITDLQTTNAKVAKIPLQFGKEDDRLDDDDRAIRGLCVGCNEVADELLGRLSLLKISKNDKEARKLESVKYAWKFMRSKRDLDSLAARVSSYRDQLQNRILVRLTERFDGLQLEQSWRFDNLERTGRDILDSIKQSRNLISADLGTQTDYLTRLAKAHHEEIIEKLDIIAGVQSASRSTSPNPPPQYGEIYEHHGVQKMTIHDIIEKGDYSELQECIRLRPDAIFDISPTGETPLHIAARKGDLKSASYLLRKGAKKNADDRNDQTPLHLAVQAGHIPLVRFLVSKGADHETEDIHGKIPKAYAPKDSVISWILNVGAGLEDKDEKGCTALRNFVRLGDIDIVRSLLEQGADIENKLEGNGFTCLVESGGSSEAPYNSDMMDLLIAHGADVNAEDVRDGTPIVILAWGGHTAPIQKLLDHGANIDAYNNVGYTALHEASYHPHLWEETALMLLDRGANPDMKVDGAYSPLCLASQAGSMRLVRRMLDLGANVNMPSVRGWTPLHEACEHGHLEVVKTLLEHGANIDPKNIDGHTPLTRAADNGNIDIVRFLLEIGKADINAPQALAVASRSGRYDVVELLLQKGAKVDTISLFGDTPIESAKLGGHSAIVELLQHNLLESTSGSRPKEV